MSASDGFKGVFFACRQASAPFPPNVQGKPAAAKTVGRQKTRDPPLGLTDLLGGCSFAVPKPFGRQTTFNSPTDHQPAVVGFRFAFRGYRRSIRRTAINGHCACGSLFRHRTADGKQLRDRLSSRIDCALISRSRAERQSGEAGLVVHCSGIERRTTINCRLTFEPECVIVFCSERFKNQSRRCVCHVIHFATALEYQATIATSTWFVEGLRR